MPRNEQEWSEREVTGQTKKDPEKDLRIDQRKW